MPPHDQQSAGSFRQGMGLTLWWAEIFSVFPAVFLHRFGSWGKRYPAPAVGVAAILTPLLAFAFVGGQDPRVPPSLRRTQDAQAFLIFWAVWLLGFLLHKLTATVRQTSYYDGTPRLSGKRGRFEIPVKRFLEPLFCLGFGAWMQEHHLPAFGSFWMLCGLAYALSMGLAVQHMNRMAWDRLDAELNAAIQQEWADQFRPR